MHLSQIKKNGRRLNHSKAILSESGRDQLSDTLTYVLDQDNLIISIEGVWMNLLARMTALGFSKVKCLVSHCLISLVVR